MARRSQHRRPHRPVAALAGIAFTATILAGCAAVAPATPAVIPASPTPSILAGASTVAGHALFAPSPERAGISRDEAISIARAAVPRRSSDGVLQAIVGTFADLGDPYAPSLVSPAPGPEKDVWLVNLGFIRGPLDGQGTDVIIDASDGRVLQMFDWVS